MKVIVTDTGMYLQNNKAGDIGCFI
jgi:hypothetical protein